MASDLQPLDTEQQQSPAPQESRLSRRAVSVGVLAFIGLAVLAVFREDVFADHAAGQVQSKTSHVGFAAMPWKGKANAYSDSQTPWTASNSMATSQFSTGQVPNRGRDVSMWAAAVGDQIKLQPASNSAITEDDPLHVIIAGAGVGGLALASFLSKDPKMKVSLVEKTSEFRRFGGPIQLASNAMQLLKTYDPDVYAQVNEKFTLTGDKINGIKDGIRDEWYAKFDLATPAETRNLPYTGVIERPDLQEIYLKNLPKGTVRNGNGVAGYETQPDGTGVRAILENGEHIDGDVIIGADGIWSAVRASMRNEPAKGEGSGVAYSGYTLFAGELTYDSFDNGEVGYKVYIGPGQYFVITDIGNGRYQWYGFLARPPGSAKTEEMSGESVPFLKKTFEGWAPEILKILDATKEEEIGQRDLYDRPPSVRKGWSDGPVALLGDAIHAMMPNLGQGGCQAMEDAIVIAEELKSATHRGEIDDKLQEYRNRRVIRSSTVQGLSRIASDIIIKGFDTPAKIEYTKEGGWKFERLNYAGIVTRLIQPVLPALLGVQFNFLYAGWENKEIIDAKAALGLLFIGSLVLLTGAGLGEGAGLGLGLGLETLFEADTVETLLAAIRDMGAF
jgi:zeaxanthin epoxidase